MATKNDRVASFRRLNNLTQTELGEYLGVSKSFVSQIENGRVDLPYSLRQRLLQNDRGWDVAPLMGDVIVGDGSTVNNGHDQTVSADAGLVAALREAQAQNAKSQEQIDRLLGIIEGFQGSR